MLTADASAHVVSKGSGQMALSGASASQRYKPLLFTMVATNLLYSTHKQHLAHAGAKAQLGAAQAQGGFGL